MTYHDQPDHSPAAWIATGCFATEAEIDAILGAGFDYMQSPTAGAITSGRAVRLHG